MGIRDGFGLTSNVRGVGVVLVLLLLATRIQVSEAATVPLGLPEPPPGKTHSPELALLGHRLFEDRRLSADGAVSCASCHVPDRHFADARPTASARPGSVLTRHTPSLLNVRYERTLFWEGRVTELAAQATVPLLGPAEHGFADPEALARVVRADSAYAEAFQRLLGVGRATVGINEVTAALAAYEETLVAGDSPFDRYEYGAEPSALSPAAIRGLALFRGRAQCASCHLIGEESALFSDQDFHATPLRLSDTTLAKLGELTSRVKALRERGAERALNALIASDANIAALGRYVVTLDPKDIGRFKTPSLRNIAFTGPYMHDGSVPSLPQAIELELYSRSTQRYPLVLTEDERGDILQFLLSLSSPQSSP